MAVETRRALASLTIRGAALVERGVGGVVVDTVIRDGRVVAIGPGLARREEGVVIDAEGWAICPGFFDLHAHLREPGQEHKETIESGARAAAAGGFTRVLAMANTEPPVDNLETLGRVQAAAARAPVRVLSVAAVTKGLRGEELTDFNLLAQFGAAAFSDDGRNRYGDALAAEALAAARAVDRVVMVHAQDEASHPGAQADPSVAAQSGLEPWPCSAEVEVVATAIDACRATRGRLHIQHVSCAETVGLLREARAEGLPVTAEATPHHLALTSDLVLRNGSPDPMAKVNPPLRGGDDRRAVLAGLRDGVIDAIATDHAPHAAAEKETDFTSAAFGFSGFETAVALCLRLVEMGELSIDRMVEALTWGARDCLLPLMEDWRPAIRVGEAADLVLIDTNCSWTVDPEAFTSMGRNTPLAGEELRGKVMLTIAGGRVAHAAAEVPLG